MKNNLFQTIVLFFFLIGLNACTSKNKEPENPDVYYTCSMDPQVSETKPGNCPICKMPLTATKKNKSDTLHLSEQQIQLGHIIIDTLKNQILGNELMLTGVLTVDQNTSEVISTKVMGRIEKLYIKDIGKPIQKGEPLYDIYSEDLILSIKELKFALENKKNIKNPGSNIEGLIQSSRKKLSFYGLSDEHIKTIEENEIVSDIVTIRSPKSGTISAITTKEGSYVMEGGEIMQLADYKSLWAEAQIFSEDLSEIKEGMYVTVYIPEMDNKQIEGKISFINPQLNPLSKINSVRIEIKNENQILKPGMQANFTILFNKFTALAIPTDAVLLDEKGTTVWIQTGYNKFKSVMVHTGEESNGYTEIKHGLNAGDKIVISGAYLLNSEYIFKKGANPMEGHDMSHM